MRSLEIIVSLSLALGVSALAAPVNPRSMNAASQMATTECERETVLDFASPGQDESSLAGNNADTTSYASPPSSDVVSNPPATSTSSLSEAADSAQIANTNSGDLDATVQFGAFVPTGNDLVSPAQAVSSQANRVNILAPNLQNGAVSTPQAGGVNYLLGISSGNLDPVNNLALDTLDLQNAGNTISQSSGLDYPPSISSGNLAASNIYQNGPVNSISQASGLNLISPASSLSSQARPVNALGPDFTIPLTRTPNSAFTLEDTGALPAGISSGSAFSIMANDLAQNGAGNSIPLGSALNSNPLAPSPVNALGPDLTIPLTQTPNSAFTLGDTGALPAGISFGSALSIMANDLAQNGAGNSIPLGSALNSNPLAPSPVNTLGSDLTIPQNSDRTLANGLDNLVNVGLSVGAPQNVVTDDIPLVSGLDAFEPLSLPTGSLLSPQALDSTISNPSPFNIPDSLITAVPNGNRICTCS